MTKQDARCRQTLDGVLRLRCAADNHRTHCRFAALRMTVRFEPVHALILH